MKGCLRLGYGDLLRGRTKLVAVGLDVVLITAGVGSVLFVVVLCLQLARDGVTLW